MILPHTASRKKAIAYYRHSAEDKQENSVAIQRDHAVKFAKENGIEIIHEEADEGISGLSADRAGFQNLFNGWILNDRAPPFEYVLVYDVSRWGRFQNPDEAGMYQYQCARRGKKLVFVERGKLHDEQALIGHLQTSIERYMAAEYSRQLSNKVFFGSKKISEQGYSVGGTACYGMSRLLLNINKQPIRILKPGEHKQISNERVTFMPSEDEASRTVHEIFNLCAVRGYTPHKISESLNERKTPSPNGGTWNSAKVRKILRNETYTGTRIYNKRWSRLKQKSRNNPRKEWVICRDAFPAIISLKIFQKAQENLTTWSTSKKSREARIIRVLRQSIHEDLRLLLREKNICDDLVTWALRDAPVTFSMSFRKSDADIGHWCFIISEGMKNFDHIFAIGVQTNSEQISYEILCIPISVFGENNFVLISAEEKNFCDFKLSEEQLTNKIQNTLDRAVNRLPLTGLTNMNKNQDAEIVEQIN